MSASPVPASPLSIAVVGGGLMGHGIAQVFAVAGHRVAVTDPSPAVRDSVKSRIGAHLNDLNGGLNASILDRVRIEGDVNGAVRGADIVFEAAPENLELKQDLFVAIERAAPAGALLASNTSVIPITQVMAKVGTRARTLGTHWWNPPYLVPLVEVIRTADTSDASMTAMLDLLRSVGKAAVEVKKDVPGFIGNRLQAALWREAMSIVGQGICDAQTLDTVVKASFGRRLPVLGPLENADLIGTDLTLAIHRYVLPHIDATPGPVPLLETLVGEGKLGFRTGEGFRRWTPAEQDSLRRRLDDHLRAMDDEDRAPEASTGTRKAAPAATKDAPA